MGMPDVFCECPVYLGDNGWFRCGRPARLVSFPRTPPRCLCEEHEREATAARAAVTPRLQDPQVDQQKE